MALYPHFQVPWSLLGPQQPPKVERLAIQPPPYLCALTPPSLPPGHGLDPKAPEILIDPPVGG